MGFLRKIFGGSSSTSSGRGDSDGFFLYAQCSRCGRGVRLRISKQYDLNRDDSGYVWHKTIVDNRCFQPMRAVIHFDNSYKPVTMEIDKGRFISEDEYKAVEESQAADSTAPDD